MPGGRRARPDKLPNYLAGLGALTPCKAFLQIACFMIVFRKAFNRFQGFSSGGRIGFPTWTAGRPSLFFGVFFGRAGEQPLQVRGSLLFVGLNSQPQ